MALPKNLVKELKAALKSFAAAHGNSAVPGAAGKALEAWLIMRLASHARASTNWSVSLRRGDGTALQKGKPFKLPGYQAGILKGHPDGPGFVLIEKISDPSISLELHGGLQWKGRSDATHECDVSLLPSTIARPLRVAGGHPRGLPIVAFECKDRHRTGSTDEMRETLARLFDLTFVTYPYPKFPCRIFEAATHKSWGRHHKRYIWFLRAGAFGIVRDGRFSLGATRLGTHFSIGLHGRIYSDPNAIKHVEDRFLETIDAISASSGI